MVDDNKDFKDIDFDRPSVQESASKVAPPPAKNLLVIIIGIIAAIYIIYSFLFSDDGSSDNQKKEQSTQIDLSQAETIDTFDDPVISIAPPIPELPSLPENEIDNNQLPELPEPPSGVPAIPPSTLAPPTPAPIAPPELPRPKDNKESEQNDRKKSGMIISGGGGGNSEGNERSTATFGSGGGPHSDFILRPSSATSSKATQINHDLSATIAQGKMIDAVLETAINTDHQGLLRAIVSHDVYAEKGENVLIPKGSRLVGNYLADIKRGQARVYIVWNRVIRPDGVDIAIQSDGTDDLGRVGMEGVIDNKYFEMIANSVLLSSVTTAFAALSNYATKSEGSTSTTSNANGTTTTSGKSVDVATQEGVDNLGEVTKKIADNYLGAKPTISVAQGTRLKVFVNKDLMFPRSIARQVKVIQ